MVPKEGPLYFSVEIANLSLIQWSMGWAGNGSTAAQPWSTLLCHQLSWLHTPHGAILDDGTHAAYILGYESEEVPSQLVRSDSTTLL